MGVTSKNAEKSSLATKDRGDNDDEDEDEEDLDSRTSVFDKKRSAYPLTPFVGEKKKKKKWLCQNPLVYNYVWRRWNFKF